MFSLQFNEQYNSLILVLATMLLSMVLGLIIISALNIRQRSDMKNELKDSEQKYRELAVQLPQAVFELDALGNVVFINPLGCQLLGYTPEDLSAGLNIRHVVVQEERELVNNDIIVLNITYLTYHVRIWESMISQRKDSSPGQESYPSRFL